MARPKWMETAAKEIAEFAHRLRGRSHGKGDDYTTAEQFAAAENIIINLLEKNYELPQCRDCNRWRTGELKGISIQWGICSYLNSSTVGEFGCVEWQAK